MEVIGIIAEYNPFHNGHIYHINKIKEKYPDSILIAVVSSTFTQRGYPSIINKWDKTSIALNHGIDIVVELPFYYATQSADIFAKGAVTILEKIGINRLIFGSESNDIEGLKILADTQLNNNEYNEKVKEYLDSGLNYPTSMSRALYDISNVNINEPNDILALSYIKVILENNYNIEIESIKRTNNYLSDVFEGEVSSATSIRCGVKNNIDIEKYVPNDTYQILKDESIFLDDYFDILKYKIITCRDLSIYLDVDEGIESRLNKYVNVANNMDEFIELVHTKRYTYNKIRRMLIHILCDFTKEDKLNYNNIEFIRVLGFSNNGRNYLNSIKKTSNISIITNFNSNNKYLDLEMKVTKVYALVSCNYEKLIKMEVSGPIIKDEI